MVINWRFLPLSTNDANTNMAIDEALFKAKTNDPELPNTIRFYRWKPSAVSIGKNQDLSNEVDINKAKKLGIDIVRRISGGGAVFHDYFGEITYCIVVSRKDLEYIKPHDFYKQVLSAIGNACTTFGIESEYGQIHCPAVFVDGKKISGNAQAVHKDVILQHGTILLDYNPELMYTVLKARPNIERKKMIESVYSRVTTLSKILKRQISIKEFIKPLKNGFQKEFNINSVVETLTMNESEKKMIHFYKTSRYQSIDWNFYKKNSLIRLKD
ncbi:MAG: lipoate--protein ligase family protein [Candidatus Hodarchaeales archaeon]